MAKRTAIVDLGSNSVRLVIFEKSSRYAFHTLAEYKRKVRLGENAYNNAKFLQAQAMQRTLETLEYFKEMVLKHKCKKILIVGTSALRDAPNGKDFIKEVKTKLGLNIRCIDGKTESYLGGLAALNLLSNIKNATTLDIGGGSSELCLIKDGKIQDCLSLDLGTVRLKELFYDTNKLEKLDAFLDESLKLIPEHFKNDKLIAIGGSLRAISSSIMDKNSYPLKTLHEFSYKLENEKKHLERILNANIEDLYDYGIKKDRFDTIKEGTLIFTKIATKLGTKEVITSGVGVREGVYLNDILPPNKRFASNFNPSVRSLQDRFLGKQKTKIPHYVSLLFDELSNLHNLDAHYKSTLIHAAKLCNIGSYLNFYFSNEHSSYFILNALNYNFSHQEKALIAILIRSAGRKIGIYAEPFKELLPPFEIMTWLNFMLGYAKIIALNHPNESKLEFTLHNNSLYLYSIKNLNIPKDELKKLILPQDLVLVLNQKP
ncbi:Ppx/GppA phosphatase family protein [Campylobacter sp. MIT 97-5078]|uniref:Ppx/GppA phosphatase family protein n=1 Tax=Campylobacter sp. MIT 97-5078 TaxID=1548153 RepID=UPI00051340D3|nr:Ppx/GppA phosphatase family protein [Campylobacter sp. MIT 97-5078]KGI56545.1 guanosine polyphosphate pyrophosphohydrolase [Campylobacter sp. MIT 97-5078]TQR27004.1 Ppx/GppA family phosphatase [Campylobacter sp. MIT 97-5078]